MWQRRRVLMAAGVALAVLPTVAVRAGASEVREGVLGDPNAPVTIIEYFSLTCPHCAAFHKETLPVLKQRYIDTGKVKLVLRDFPLDRFALFAAVIAHCAGPERYPAFVDVFLETQQQWARADDPVAVLKQIAQLGGLAPEQADACLADQAMIDAVLKMRLEGENTYKVQSTPSFIIGGKLYAGHNTPERFAELIEPLLPKG
jgi:protein-disulfide isomerase